MATKVKQFMLLTIAATVLISTSLYASEQDSFECSYYRVALCDTTGLVQISPVGDMQCISSVYLNVIAGALMIGPAAVSGVVTKAIKAAIRNTAYSAHVLRTYLTIS